MIFGGCRAFLRLHRRDTCTSVHCFNSVHILQALQGAKKQFCELRADKRHQERCRALHCLQARRPCTFCFWAPHCRGPASRFTCRGLEKTEGGLAAGHLRACRTTYRSYQSALAAIRVSSFRVCRGPEVTCTSYRPLHAANVWAAGCLRACSRRHSFADRVHG